MLGTLGDRRSAAFYCHGELCERIYQTQGRSYSARQVLDHQILCPQLPVRPLGSPSVLSVADRRIQAGLPSVLDLLDTATRQDVEALRQHSSERADVAVRECLRDTSDASLQSSH
mmetsp:Transcript_134974/g.247724  ORF Transcript_134974/g.247724 Transcript_134974/m.247724 type:complete len:115 (+) Transcript_134974:412-756(+)